MLAGMVNSDWPEEDAYAYLCDSANVGGRFLQQLNARNAGRARSWLHRQYQETQRWVAQHPAHDPLEDSAVLASLAAHAELGLGLSAGQAGVTERAVLRYLITKGLEHSSVIVRASYRQISEATCANLDTVKRAVDRLRRNGWLEIYEPAKGHKAASYRLVGPAAGSFITEVPLFTGGKDTPVPKLPASVHQLFAGQGLGRGPQETFAALPFFSRQVGHGVLLAVDRAVPRQAKSTVPSAERSLVRAPVGPGRTAQEIADALSKDVTTVRRHLRRLAQAHMAFADRDGRWYRYYFDPTTLAAYLDVPDTPKLLRERFDRDRDGYFEFLTTAKGRAIHDVRISRSDDGSDYVYIDETSGEVVHRRARPRDAGEELSA